jgi:Uma2 family endonuclease
MQAADSATAPVAEPCRNCADPPRVLKSLEESTMSTPGAPLAVHGGYNDFMPGADDVKPATDDGVKLTYDDFLLFPDDGKRHELIEGEHYVTPSPNIRHQEILGRLHLLIGTWLVDHQIGRLFVAPLDVLFSNFDVVEPDLLYVSNERASVLAGGKHVAGAPDLVVEIGSPGTRQRDETIKRRLYERFGVVEYWVVDPDIDVIRVYRREGKRFARPMELAREASDVLTTPLLPGLELPLVRVFGE